jgi:uncharacterized membrane protein
METGRLEAFSDGVIAVIITIMVLDLKIPHGTDLRALAADLPTFVTYVLSFVNTAIYWNNHHHMLHATKRIDGRIMWANMHLLFWLSLIPFTTGWAGENHFAPVPTAAYGFVLLMGRGSLLVAPDSDRRTQRDGFRTRPSDRAGLERQSLDRELCPFPSGGFFCADALRSRLHRGRGVVAHPRPSHRTRRRPRCALESSKALA